MREGRDISTSLAMPAAMDGTDLSVGGRLLLSLTTTPWKPDRPVDPTVARLAAGMAETGWRIRSAEPRNYLLWHCGRTLTQTRCRLVVLPRRFGRLSRVEIDVFLFAELAAARWRVSHDTAPLSSAAREARDTCCRAIASRHGWLPFEPERVLGTVRREIGASLAGAPWPRNR
ncbi:hypothetical protein [Jiella avicenniae]|uniref:Uncharacterized protein n=1 Tax=Jiella avicenniae TaxID=2907202 RepID=A0A9X1P486_9HYPH|nr:hypothetical protein [Jiella avicenniae]MCE7030158.1 hypothetical protein [Jiella avicenniae]